MTLDTAVQWVGLGGGLVATAIGLAAYQKSVRIREEDLHARVELSSVDLFKLEIEHPELMKIYHEQADKDSSLMGWNDCWDKLREEDKRIAEFAASLLNLFEIHYELRLHGDIGRDKFASWIPWLRTLCRSESFRCIWKGSFRKGYIPRLRVLIDVLIESRDLPEAEFYEQASKIVKRGFWIMTWPDKAIRDLPCNPSDKAADGRLVGSQLAI